MGRSILFSAVLASTLLALTGCQTPSAVQSTTSPNLLHADKACVVTASSFKHIYDRHCTASSGASQLLPAYCTSAATAQTFCTMVQGASSQTRTIQPDGRVRYDANLGAVVGTAGEKCGRLIINSATDGTVVTTFPELSGAPGSCS